MKDAHRLLRDATRDAHQRLDALFGGFDLGDRSGYTRFIGAQADAMLACEGALDAAGADAVLDDWPARRRGHLLVGDAAALGIAPPNPTPAPDLAQPERAAAIAGALYVIEGSRHGARHLRSQVAPGLPAAFLHADQPPGSWAKLLASIDSILYSTAAREAAIAAALDTFGVFERAGQVWLTKE